MVPRSSASVSVVALGLLLTFLPAAARAQQGSAIAGVVRDTSGAVLPGVTVEAASPALIEKVRVVVSDGQGRYNIVDLRPGTYSVTFTLPGFNTLVREGVALPAGFTATVNAELRVGTLEETITVTGEAPLVDTQNVRAQTVVSSELRAVLPSGTMNLMTLTRIIPGMSSGLDVGGGGATGIYYSNQSTSVAMHGKGSTKDTFDGMQMNNLSGIGSVTYIVNPVTVEETVIETAGISAESNASGLSINMVPKDGGNTFSFGARGTYTNEHLQGDNLSDTLRARGVGTPGKVLYAYDANYWMGGPIRRDRLWFFAASRLMGTQNQVPDKFFNATQGTPIFTPDLERPQYRQDWLRGQAARITWQASAKNKINGFVDPQFFMTRGTGGNTAPEAHTCWYMWPAGVFQTSWTSTVTNRLLLEAGAGLAKGLFPCTRENVTDIFGFTVGPNDISVLESTTGFRYNASNSYSPTNDHDRYSQRFSMSYVTGSHTFKVGFQDQQLIHNQLTEVNRDVTYTFTRGVPTRITQFATPYLRKNRTKADLGIFAQDQWVINRMTLNYGVRYEYFNGYVPEQHVPAGQFVGERRFAAVNRVPAWTDVNPRLGVAYDLFGTGRTAIKASLGRYVGKEAVSVAQVNNPIATSINSVNRTWNDANANYVPDCDLKNFSANGECGPISNNNFGQVSPDAIRFSDDVIRGFGTRDYLWDLSTELQHELSRGVSLIVGYYRNWSNHFRALPRGDFSTVYVADNLALSPTDFDPFCITAPVDPRLPGGGGYQVCGLYDIAPAKFGVGNELVRRASDFERADGTGTGKYRYSDFVTASIKTRFGRGIELGGSIDTGRTVEDNCFVVDSPQALLHCRVVNPFGAQTQIKLHGVFPLPGGISVSGIYDNVSGTSYMADYTVSNAAIVPSLGRNLAACGNRAVCTATVVVPLIAPQSHFEARRNLVDLRMTKQFSLGPRTRLRANFDIYNVFNDASILGTNNNYGVNWLRPEGTGGGLRAARLFQFGAELNF